MTHDELVEKVARSIYESRNGVGATPWTILTKARKEPYQGDARAALSVVYEAIREPTPVMISAGENSEYAGGTMGGALDHANYGGLPVAYRAMLDASALKPGALSC